MLSSKPDCPKVQLTLNRARSYTTPMRTHLTLLGLLCVAPALASEPRTCGGNVQVEVVNGALFITGDDQPNCLGFDRDYDGEPYVWVGSASDTTVNGTTRFDARDVTGNVTIRLGDGDDRLSYGDSNSFFPANLTIDTGDGDDTLIFTDLHALGSIFIRTGDGNDGLSAATLVAGHTLAVSMGDGDDWFSDAVEPYGYGTRVAISMGRGNDFLQSSGGPIAEQVTIRTGSGNDTVDPLEDHQGVTGQRLILSLGAGDDSLRRIDLSRDSHLNGGSGFDTLGTIRLEDVLRHRTSSSGASRTGGRSGAGWVARHPLRQDSLRALITSPSRTPTARALAERRAGTCVRRLRSMSSPLRRKQMVVCGAAPGHVHAQDFAARIENRVVVIDGPTLATMMIDHNVGVAAVRCFDLKRIDSDFFSKE